MNREQDDSLMGVVGSKGIKQKTKRTHGHKKQCGDCGGTGVGRGGRRYKGDKW